MKFTKVMLSLATLALGVASAASGYEVKLSSSLWVGATEIKAGEYKVEMQGDKAVFKSGKKVVQVPATFGASDQKFAFTAVLSTDSKLHEIDLGGTKSKIVFASEAAGASAGQ